MSALKVFMSRSRRKSRAVRRRTAETRRVRAALPTLSRVRRGARACRHHRRAVLRWPVTSSTSSGLLLVVVVAALIYGLARLGIFLFVWGARRRARSATLRGWMLRQTMTRARRDVHQARPGDVDAARPVRARDHRPAAPLQDKLPPFSFRKVKTVDRGRARQADSASCSPSSTRSRSRPPASRRSIAPGSSDGREVAVKVLRPGVRRQVERDKAILLGGAHAARDSSRSGG